MFDDILGPRPENVKDDELPELELELTEEELEELNMEPIDADDLWGNVDTSNNAEPPDNDDCDGSCDGCGC